MVPRGHVNDDMRGDTMKNKKILLSMLILIGLQITFMYYLFQKTQQRLIVSLSITVYLIFALGYYYGYSKEFQLLKVLSVKKEDKFKLQNQYLKITIQYGIHAIITILFLSVLFEISFPTSSRIALLSGGLGMTTAAGLYEYKIEVGEKCL